MGEGVEAFIYIDLYVVIRKRQKLTFSPPGGKLGMLNSRFWSPSLGVVGAVVGLLFILSRSGPPF